MKELMKKIKQNHWLMMIICCGIPLILLVGAIYLFGLSKSYLYWFVLLLCPLMHFFMMKDMHKKHSNKEELKKKLK